MAKPWNLRCFVIVVVEYMFFFYNFAFGYSQEDDL